MSVEAPVTVEELQQAEARFQRASRRFEEARTARNETVRLACAEGWTHDRIARATGLTRSRVGQLVLTAPAARLQAS
jgi:hypothetical protein